MKHIKVQDTQSAFDNVLYWIEYARCFLMVPGKIEQLVAIVNLEDVSMLTLPGFTASGYVNELSFNYPSRLSKLFLINTPTLFKPYWQMFVLPSLSSAARERIHLLSGTGNDLLLQYIRRSQLEKSMGGGGMNARHYRSSENPFVPIMPPLRLNHRDVLGLSQSSNAYRSEYTSP